MELKNKSFTIQELYNIAKEGPSKTIDGNEIDKLAFIEENDFYRNFEFFLNQQYRQINGREIQKETMEFILQAKYEIEEEEVDYEEYDTLLKIEDVSFKIGHLCRDWVLNLSFKGISREDFREYRNGEIFFRFHENQIEDILKSDAYNYIKKFNETKRMERRYPQKESIIKKIINKI